MAETKLFIGPFFATFFLTFLGYFFSCVYLSNPSLVPLYLDTKNTELDIENRNLFPTQFIKTNSNSQSQLTIPIQIHTQFTLPIHKTIFIVAFTLQIYKLEGTNQVTFTIHKPIPILELEGIKNATPTNGKSKQQRK